MTASDEELAYESGSDYLWEAYGETARDAAQFGEEDAAAEEDAYEAEMIASGRYEAHVWAFDRHEALEAAAALADSDIPF
jgi:hypothetical protein